MAIQRLSNAGQTGYRYKSLIAGITPVASVPTIGAATALTFSTASVTFTAPGAYGATTFTATSSPGGLTGTSASSPITVSGLSEQTAYTFTVTATNSTGTSSPSAASNSITTPVAFSPDSGYDSLATVTLSASASSITFAGIPSGYKHLQIRMLGVFTGSVGSGYIAFNGDNASGNYSYHAVGGDGTSPGTAALSSQNQGKFTGFAGTSPAANNVMVMDILDYANINKYKTTRAFYCWDANGTGYVEFNSNNWRSLSAITSIVFTPANTFNTYTSVALYGVK